MKKLLVILILLSVTVVSFGGGSNKKKVTVEIEFNDSKHEPLKIETHWDKGLTALEALQFVAEVKTKPVCEYVFVTSINGVEGVKNKSVWYYKINGESAKKIAINQPLKSGDVITWIYKKDICSRKK